MFKLVFFCLEQRGRSKNKLPKSQIWKFADLFLKFEYLLQMCQFADLRLVDPNFFAIFGLSSCGLKKNICVPIFACSTIHTLNLHNTKCLCLLRRLRYKWCFLDIARARILKLLRSPGVDSKKSISSAYVAWRAVTITLFLLGSLPL
jgi:hypothetical protein